MKNFAIGIIVWLIWQLCITGAAISTAYNYTLTGHKATFCKNTQGNQLANALVGTIAPIPITAIPHLDYCH